LLSHDLNIAITNHIINHTSISTISTAQGILTELGNLTGNSSLDKDAVEIGYKQDTTGSFTEFSSGALMSQSVLTSYGI
jgi:hypothetical protein